MTKISAKYRSSTRLSATSNHSQVKISGKRAILSRKLPLSYYRINSGYVGQQVGTKLLKAASKYGKVGVISNIIRNTAHGVPATNILHVAALFGKTMMANQIIQNGVNIDCIDEQGRTPLHYAAYRGRLETVAELSHLGANANSKDLNGMFAGQMFHTDVSAQIMHKVMGLINSVQWRQKFRVMKVEEMIDSQVEKRIFLNSSQFPQWTMEQWDLN
mmetsp:Transcript_21621/g.31360  ORF Transcript_21621/g.31360 Transcript_21621/m.31360 type:complete len:216 (-) Transcript_21621:37-684(-)